MGTSELVMTKPEVALPQTAAALRASVTIQLFWQSMKCHKDLMIDDILCKFSSQ